MTWHEPQKNHQGKSPRHVEVSAKKSLNSTSRVSIVPKIIDSGYPTNSPSYPSAHKRACGHEISKFGISNFLSLEKIVSKTPQNELIGTHDKEGNIKISSKVPQKFIQEVAEHERVEHNLMTLKTWLSDIEAQLSAVNGIHSAKTLRSRFRSQWQNEYNYMFEQLPANIQEELTAQILAMPVRIQARINEYEDD